MIKQLLKYKNHYIKIKDEHSYNYNLPIEDCTLFKDGIMVETHDDDPYEYIKCEYEIVQHERTIDNINLTIDEWIAICKHRDENIRHLQLTIERKKDEFAGPKPDDSHIFEWYDKRREVEISIVNPLIGEILNRIDTEIGGEY